MRSWKELIEEAEDLAGYAIESGCWPILLVIVFLVVLAFLAPSHC